MAYTYRLKTAQVEPVPGNHNAYLKNLIIGSSTCVDADVPTMDSQRAIPQNRSKKKSIVKWPDMIAIFDDQACYFSFLARIKGDKHFHIMAVGKN